MSCKSSLGFAKSSTKVTLSMHSVSNIEKLTKVEEIRKKLTVKERENYTPIFLILCSKLHDFTKRGKENSLYFNRFANSLSKMRLKCSKSGFFDHLKIFKKMLKHF